MNYPINNFKSKTKKATPYPKLFIKPCACPYGALVCGTHRKIDLVSPSLSNYIYYIELGTTATIYSDLMCLFLVYAQWILSICFGICPIAHGSISLDILCAIIV